MNLATGPVGRVAAGFVLLVVVAGAVGSTVGRGETAAPNVFILVVVVGAAVAVSGGSLFAVWAGGNAAFAGTSVRAKALVVMGMGAAVLAALLAIVVLPRLVSERPWVPAYGHRACVDGVFFWMHYPNRRDELFQDPERFCWTEGVARKMSSHGGAPTEISGTLVAIVAGGSVAMLIVGGAVLAMAVRRSRRNQPTAVAEDEVEVLQALDESLDDLRRERDVRRAIVACYARMERALAGVGRERRASETPSEFLRRVLERVAHEPGQVLTELFERARFSVEPMGEQDKRSAIAALEALRARVAG